MRVCIIGAGPCGISLLRAFHKAADKGEKIPEVVCYEKQHNYGGLWLYSWRTAYDEYGESAHSTMYRHLWSNGPKEGLEFADYSFDEHFGKSFGSYPPREVLIDYIHGRAAQHDLKKWIRFNIVVRQVTFDPSTEKFKVKSHDLKERRDDSQEFDYVVVATGHFSTPNVPNFDGLETFPGRVIHSREFRDAADYVGKDILVVGSSYSAEDLGAMCLKYGAKSITFSYRTSAMPFKWPDNCTTVPLLTKVDGKRCTFSDGTSKEVDAIFLCTGYHHYFPFLGDDLRLETTNRPWCTGLFKGLISMKNSKLLFLGMQDQWYTFTMFDAQAWYVRDFLMGKIELPLRHKLQEEYDQWQAKESQLKTEEDRIEFQGAYVKTLMDETDYPKFDIDKTNKAFFDWEQNKLKSIMGYRDAVHCSAITGTPSTKHHTPWNKEFDDSITNYLK